MPHPPLGLAAHHPPAAQTRSPSAASVAPPGIREVWRSELNGLVPDRTTAGAIMCRWAPRPGRWGGGMGFSGWRPLQRVAGRPSSPVLEDPCPGVQNDYITLEGAIKSQLCKTVRNTQNSQMTVLFEKGKQDRNKIVFYYIGKIDRRRHQEKNRQKGCS